MLKSMTGYGRASKSEKGYEITFEIRSVNNRYLDTNIRLPRVYGFLEETIKKAIAKRAARGKIDAFLSVERPAGEDTQILIDQALAAQYIEALRSLKKNHKIKDDLSLSTLARLPDLFTKKTRGEDENEIRALIEPLVEEALDRFLAMRTTEGENLFLDLDKRLDRMEEILGQIKGHSAEALSQYREKLEGKLREYLKETPIDEPRLLTEVGIIADKIDTGEEITRLGSHIEQFRALIRQDTPSGRTMDFLTQELNREVNTIGSKCAQLEVTSLVIDAKNEIERIREQIQNIE